MEGAFKLIAGCFKPVANSQVSPISSSAAAPKESCKGNEKKKEKGAKSKKGCNAPIPTSYFPLGSNLSRL
uniref:Uncharacterized protein n=1 Tax=Picea sitchensis TaxID=3332 RepID=A9NSE3_PICSI|nr:unknown [Picea sitchensis]